MQEQSRSRSRSYYSLSSDLTMWYTLRMIRLLLIRDHRCCGGIHDTSETSDPLCFRLICLSVLSVT